MRNYDSTIARIAGNIAGNLLDKVLVVRIPDPGGGIDGLGYPQRTVEYIAAQAVAIARAIVAETIRTEPPPPTP